MLGRPFLSQLLVIEVVLVVINIDGLNLLKFLPNGDGLLLRLLQQSALTFLLHFAFDDFLQSLVGLSLLLVHFLDVGAEFLEVVDVLIEAIVLNGEWVTTRAASRCSALMVFLLCFSHISLERAASLVTKAAWRIRYFWRVTTFW